MPFLLLLIAGQSAITAQDTVSVSPSPIKGLKTSPLKSTQDTDSVSLSPVKRLKISPLKATMLASVFPGLGQIYTRKYWKVPFVYGGFIGVGYAVAYNTKWYNRYTKAFQDFTDNSPETISYVNLIIGISRDVYDPSLNSKNFSPETASYIRDQLLNQVDYFKRYRDLSYIGIGAWYLISILDANVDASLFDYDVGDNLNLTLAPFQFPLYNYAAIGMSLTLTINF